MPISPRRWRRIKTDFSLSLPRTERRSVTRVARGERGIWQRRYWEHLIEDDDDLKHHIDYIHYNPVKHRYVTMAVDCGRSRRFTDMPGLVCIRRIGVAGDDGRMGCLFDVD